MSHSVVLLLPPPPEEGHLDVDETFGRIIGQDRNHRVENVLHADPSNSLKNSYCEFIVLSIFISHQVVWCQLIKVCPIGM